jgi:hypothetical protein
MQALRLTLPVLASLVLAAHLLRRGWVPLAIAAALLPLVLLVRRRWAVRTVQTVLALGALEWLRTLAVLVDLRRTNGLPYLRMVAILAGVALVTAAAAPLVGAWWRRRLAVAAPAR